MGTCFAVATALIISTLSFCARAQALNEPNDEPGFSISGQTTWINQRKASLNAAYTGPNSLSRAQLFLHRERRAKLARR
jgi:hypothetical protein